MAPGGRRPMAASARRYTSDARPSRCGGYARRGGGCTSASRRLRRRYPMEATRESSLSEWSGGARAGSSTSTTRDGLVWAVVGGRMSHTTLPPGLADGDGERVCGCRSAPERARGYIGTLIHQGRRHEDARTPMTPFHEMHFVWCLQMGTSILTAAGVRRTQARGAVMSVTKTRVPVLRIFGFTNS